MLVKEKLMSQSINTLLLISSFLKHGQSNHMLTSVLLTISQSYHCLEMQPITLRHYRQRRQQSPMFPFYVANLILSDLFLVKCASVCSTHCTAGTGSTAWFSRVKKERLSPQGRRQQDSFLHISATSKLTHHLTASSTADPYFLNPALLKKH